MGLIKPSRSLNNKGILLGLDFFDFVSLLFLLMFLRVTIPVDELLILHLAIVFAAGLILSIIRLKFRKGFIYSYILGLALTFKERIESYVKN